MHKEFLLKALALAIKRKGFCAPNPAVGALLVKNNQIIAEGFHWAAGHPHAEREAIAQGGENAKGATLYVTLEPCSHWGKTPPCIDIIISHGIREVYFSYIDPNPLVRNKTITLLGEAGIPCHHLPLPEIQKFYQSYEYWFRTKKPWITAKLALSLDGKIAQNNGVPIQISGLELGKYTHQQRLYADAILTTARTLNNDNPQLNVRVDDNVIAKPIYIWDRTLSLNPSLKIFNTASDITLFYNREMAETNNLAVFKHIRCIPVSNLPEAIMFIGEDGKHDLWVEAGGQLFNALWEQQLIQRALLYISLKTLGSDAYPAFVQAHDFIQYAKMCHWQQIGNDALAELEF